MRTLNEIEMRTAAGGVSPIPLPPTPPVWEPPEVDDWWIREMLREQEVCVPTSDENPSH